MPKIKKKIFITGSSKGIGFGLAKKFSDLDFDVLINSSNTNNLKKASKKLNNCKYYLGDITSEKKAEDLLIDSKNRLSSLIMNLYSGVLLEDENRNIVLTNNQFCKLFKIRRIFFYYHDGSIVISVDK